MSPQVRSGNTWLSALGSWGDLEIERRLQGGSYEMSWGMTTKRPHRDLVPGSPVSAWLGPRSLWTGYMLEVDWVAGEFVAAGLCRQGELAPCLTGAGVTTSTPNTAVDNAIAKGWLDWSRTASISGTALTEGDTTASMNSIEELLEAYVDEDGKRWYVNPRGLVSAESISTATMPQSGFWDVLLDGDRIGTSAEKLAGTVVARYLDSAAGGARKTVIVPATGGDLPVEKVDLTVRGPISTAKATSISQAILDKAAAQVGLLGVFELTRNQILSRPSLGMVTEGHRLRIRGQHDPSGISASPVCTVDIATWNVAEDKLTVTPLGAPQRDLESIIETAGVAA
ncbi:MAG: hypothetical protein ACRDTJ_31710 [Pseudonocardiaceae bacterium]